MKIQTPVREKFRPKMATFTENISVPVSKTTLSLAYLIEVLYFYRQILKHQFLNRNFFQYHSKMQMKGLLG